MATSGVPEVEGAGAEVRKDAPQGIWLEVTEIRFDSEKGCQVRLKGDRGEEPRPWWPVAPKILTGKEDDSPLATYRAVLGEIDKKRGVSMDLRWDEAKRQLECQAVRFLSTEPGAR